jgi:feruloyl esterase
MDPAGCTFDPGSIQCPAGVPDAATCLTPAQVQTVRKLYGGPRDDRGDLLYPGWQVKGSEANWAPWLVPAVPGAPTSTTVDWNVALNTIRYLAYRDAHPTLGLQDIPFTRAGFRQIMNQTADTFDATNPDLSAFRKAGGKLILWHGWADPAITPIGTIAYYQAVQDHMGGPAATATFARLFVLPGVGHCSGGQGPDSIDALSAVVDWVQHGKAPDSFVTTKGAGNTSTVTSLPVYPYPLVATYNGTGDPGIASSYHPAPPAEPFDAHVDWLGSFSTRP